MNCAPGSTRYDRWECYDFLDEEWLEGKPYALRVLLGREDFLNIPEGAFHHGMKIPTTMNWSKC